MRLLKSWEEDLHYSAVHVVQQSRYEVVPWSTKVTSVWEDLSYYSIHFLKDSHISKVLNPCDKLKNFIFKSLASEEVSITDGEESDTDPGDPKTTPNNILSSKTIAKYYGHFREAIRKLIVM